MLYVDQPSQTGYSVGKPLESIPQVVEHFLLFFDHFLDKFPEFKNSDTYFAGESFAGIWIPYFSSSILKRNTVGPYVPLKGILLGNPWIDPLYQYPAYLRFATEHKLVNGSHLLRAEGQMNTCHNALQRVPRKFHYDICETVMYTILEGTTESGQFCINKYDYRLRDSGPNQGCGMAWPEGVLDLPSYLTVSRTHVATRCQVCPTCCYPCSHKNLVRMHRGSILCANFG
jgi:carboxypeptidase D